MTTLAKSLFMATTASVPLWTNRYNVRANGDDVETALAIDRAGNVFVTGRSWNATNDDFATVAYPDEKMPN